MKNCLSKVIGRALLKYEELEEVLLDVESFLNNRPLSYIVRKRWLNEYLPALQERVNAGSKAKHEAAMNKGVIVLLKDSTKSRANWKIGRRSAEPPRTGGSLG